MCLLKYLFNVKRLGILTLMGLLYTCTASQVTVLRGDLKSVLFLRHVERRVSARHEENVDEQWSWGGGSSLVLDGNIS